VTDQVIVLSTCSSADEAERIARHLVERRLAACVNVVPGIRSFYWWKGALEDSAEWLLVVKSRRELVQSLRAEIEATHSYDLPEVVALPIVEGSERYLRWIIDETESPGG
jgi:periplasmic divalent cation tolerance protein